MRTALDPLRTQLLLARAAVLLLAGRCSARRGAAGARPRLCRPARAAGACPARWTCCRNLPFARGRLPGAWWPAAARAGALPMHGAAARAAPACSSPACWSPPPARPGTTWRRTTAGLAVDRAGMAVAFAGLLGLAGCRPHQRPGRLRRWRWRCWCSGPLAVLAWLRTGNVLPWAVVQFGGMALVLALAWSRAACPARWPCAGAWCCWRMRWPSCSSWRDHAVFEATRRVVLRPHAQARGGRVRRLAGDRRAAARCTAGRMPRTHAGAAPWRRAPSLTRSRTT